MKCNENHPCKGSNVKVAVSRCNHRCNPPTIYTTEILKPNCVCGNNALTQCMLMRENVKYVIKYDFTLLGEEITVPKNCIFEFDGGSLKNGTIVGQNTVFINVGYVDIWGTNLIRKGTWREHSGGGGSIDVDDHLSDTSTNPVQNKVITEALENIVIPDKPYDSEAHSGLGRKTLQLKDGSNILTQDDFSDANTIYLIQYDFDLDGQEIQVPAGCVLDFEGGSANNGILHINSATLDGYPKGDAIYGIGYRDGNALTNTYKPKINISIAEEFAFLHYYSALLYVGISPQSIIVTDDYLIIGGNNEFVYTDAAGTHPANSTVVTLFDREYNFKGQAFIENMIHGNSMTLKDDNVYFVTSVHGFASLSSIVNACKASLNAPHTIHTVPTQIINELPANVDSIAYDNIFREFAVMQIENDDYFLYIYDENYNLKRNFNVPIRKYIVEHYVYSYTDNQQDINYDGVLCDIDCRNGVIVASFNYGHGYSTLVPCRSIYVLIDANTGVPISYVEGYVGGSFSTEPEGICFDPEDDDVLWVNNHDFCYAQPDVRTNTEKICRISFAKAINSVVVPSQNLDASVMGCGSPMTVWVDNSYTGISSGGLDAPFKSLETALIMTRCVGNTIRFIIKATNTPYSLGRVGISNYVIFEGEKVEDKKPIIKNGAYFVYGNTLVMKDVTVIRNPDFGAATIEAYNHAHVDLTDVDIYTQENASEINSYIDTYAIVLNDASLSIEGTLNVIGYKYAIDFRNCGTLSNVENISLSWCYRCYRFTKVGYIADGAISAIEVDDTVQEYRNYELLDGVIHPNIIENIPFDYADNETEIEEYAKRLMAKSMNNPGLVTFRTQGAGENHRGDYVYTFQYGLRRVSDNFLDKPNDRNNLLIGTAYFNIIDDNSISTMTNHNWRKSGTSPIPSVTDVSIPIYEKLKKGVKFTSINQEIAKDVANLGEDGWYTVSFLAKGHGRLKTYFHYTKNKIREVVSEISFNIDSDEWQPYYYTCYVSDFKSEDGWLLIKFALLDLNAEGDDVTMAAMKVEATSDASGWTPNMNEFPTGGTSDERPIGINVGYQYFDTILNKTIVYNGTNWVNIDGTPLI